MFKKETKATIGIGMMAIGFAMVTAGFTSFLVNTENSVEAPAAVTVEETLPDAITCIRIPGETGVFEAMISDGWDIAYENNRWIVQSEIIGAADFEDEAFDACGPTWLINTIEKYNE